ncbi:methyltransferase [Nonomuraea wenchangensis]
MNAVPPELELVQRMGELRPHEWSIGLILRGAALLGLADHLAGGPRTAAELAAATRTHPPSLARFLRACAVAGIVTPAGPDEYALTELGRVLRSDEPSLRGFVIAVNGPGLMRPWERIEHTLRTGRPSAAGALGSDLWGYYARHPDEARHYAESLVPVCGLAAAVLTSVHDLSGTRTIVDVGGCPGTLLAAVLAAAPQAQGVLLDLPAMLPHIKEIVAGHPAADRMTLTGGDFLESVPAGGDLYLLKHVLSDLDEAGVEAVVRNCLAAAAPGSRLLVIDWVTTETPSFTHVTDIDAMVTFGGRIRSEYELIGLLRTAGYRDVRRLAVPGQEDDPLAFVEAIRP